MSDKEHINEASDLVLDMVGVGSFVLISSVKNYLRKNKHLEICKILSNYDLSLCLNELIDSSIEDLTNQEVIVRIGKSIQRPSATREINHRKQQEEKK